MIKIKQIIGASVVSLGLVAGLTGGLVGAQDIGGITGPDSNNVIVRHASTDIDMDNDNNVSASNFNHQTSNTGEAEAEHNTTAGGAGSGSASNTNTFTATASVNNAGLSMGDMGLGAVDSTLSQNINNTGPDSTNKVIQKSDVDINVHNDNDLRVTNTNCQTATSGDAEVSDNTTGGSATTGNAANTSTTSTTFTVSN